MLKMKNNEGRQGLYVHIPFCLRKCDYCDFYSIPLKDPQLTARYASCAAREAELISQGGGADLTVAAIYLGGGTPSLLSPGMVAGLLNTFQQCFQVDEEAEISMEANPVRHDAGYFRDVKDSGINRLSLGVQSFQDQELKTLNRIHNAHDVLRSVEALHQVGLTNFNIDLIYGIPGQSMQSWAQTLQMALSCQPAHISMYLLQLDEKTPLARRINSGELDLLGDETEAAMYYYALDFLKTAGYCHYEISNLARPNCQCRHNLIYWKARPYIGLGAGAVSFRSNRRIINTARLDSYMETIEAGQLPPAELLEEMSGPELLADAVILGLRLTAGISRTDLYQRFGVDIMELYRSPIESGISKGLLKCENDIIALTEKGYFLSNTVLCQFLA